MCAEETHIEPAVIVARRRIAADIDTDTNVASNWSDR